MNVACGPHAPEGFLHLDLIAASAAVLSWDCRRSLPLADGAAAGVRIEQFVEHLDPREELPVLLADVRRVLAPGGVLRVIVPDAGRYLKAYCWDDLSAFAELGTPEPFPADLPTRMDSSTTCSTSGASTAGATTWRRWCIGCGRRGLRVWNA